jgi:hypothetical protein
MPWLNEGHAAAPVNNRVVAGEVMNVDAYRDPGAAAGAATRPPYGHRERTVRNFARLVRVVEKNRAHEALV